MTDGLQLEGKVCVVTGASSGIGEATALRLSGAGAAVVLAARRRDRLESLAERIGSEGGRALPIEVDITDEQQARELIDRATPTSGASTSSSTTPG